MTLPVVVALVVGAAVATAWFFASRAPAVTLALAAGLAGGVAGFVIGREDRRAGVPLEVAIACTIALVSVAVVGAFVIPASRPRQWLQDAALIAAGLVPVVATAVTVLVLWACPLYVTGRDAGFCSYGSADVLGGWVTEVIVLLVVDLSALVAALGISARRVRYRWDATPS